MEIKFSTNQAVFDLGRTTFYSRLLEGNYPETDRRISRRARHKSQLRQAHYWVQLIEQAY